MTYVTTLKNKNSFRESTFKEINKGQEGVQVVHGGLKNAMKLPGHLRFQKCFICDVKLTHWE